MLSRRAFCSLAAGAALVPRRARAAGSERRFLFVVCAGGWDPAYVFAPLFDSAYVDMETDAVAAEVGGIPFVDGPGRPAVRNFLESYADRTCFLNGFEVQSITHERCTRLLMTGNGESMADDWGAILAGHSTRALLLPHVVVSGPSYSSRYTDRVVRVGSSGQLGDLLLGHGALGSDVPVQAPSASTAARVDAYVRDRIAAWSAAAPRGRGRRLGAGYGRALDDVDALGSLAGGIDLEISDATDLVEHLDVALGCFELGLARCATVQYDGLWGMTWDSHEDNAVQNEHFQELFGGLSRLMAELDSRFDPDGVPLSETVVVVVMSEMGRNPQLNAASGKHHWTFTSAMLVGGGLAGGRAIGGWDAYMLGRPVDLASGAVAEGGTSMLAAHLGATLLALGDVDPGDHLPGVEPVTALL